MRVLVIPLGEDLYAVDMRAVREVVAAPRATRLPTGPTEALGVFNLRGEIVPLFDTALLLGLPPVPLVAFAVVTESSLGLAGLAASATPESVELGAVIAPSDGSGSRTLYAVDDRVVAVLDVETLFADTRVGAA